MAIDLDIADKSTGMIACTTSSQRVAINPNFSYGILHTGATIADAADTNLVVIGTDGAEKDADYSVEQDKMPLDPDKGVKSVTLESFAGSRQDADVKDDNTKAIITIKAGDGTPVVIFKRFEAGGGNK